MSGYGQIRVRATATDFYDGVEIRAIQESPEGRRYAQEMIMEPYTDGMWMPSLLTLGRTEAQELMDSLWQSGIRPTEGSGSAGAMRAVERHLGDMRTLVQHKYGVKL